MGEVITVGLLLWLLFGRKKDDPGIPGLTGPLLTGELDPPDEPDPPEPGEVKTPLQVWQGWVADEPTVGRGWKLKNAQGKPQELLYGPNGVIARALKKELGRASTAQERVDYYRAIGRVRSNWRLYGTLNGGGNTERFNIRNADGSVVTGTIVKSMLPRHDLWVPSLQQNTLPNRLITWGDGDPLGDWKELAHSGNRTWGVLWLPPYAAVAAGLDVTYDPAFDWPAEVYEAAGQTWATWVP